MPLDVSSSKSLYWRLGLDTANLQKDAAKAAGIIRALDYQAQDIRLFENIPNEADAVVQALQRIKEAFEQYRLIAADPAQGAAVAERLFPELQGYGSYEGYLRKMLETMQGNIEAERVIRQELAELALDDLYRKAGNTAASPGAMSTEEIRAQITALNELRKQFREYSVEYENVTRRIIDLNDELWERNAVHLGDIADQITEGFRQGFSSAEDFADGFEGLLKQAVIGAFRAEVNAGLARNWYTEFSAAMESGGGLDLGEVASLRGSWAEVIQKSQAIWDQIEAATGLDISGDLARARKRGLAGAVQGITEKTAGLLEGQFNAVRVNTVELLKYVGPIAPAVMEHVRIAGELSASMRHTVDRLDRLVVLSTDIADTNRAISRAVNRVDSNTRPDKAGWRYSDYLRAVGGRY